MKLGRIIPGIIVAFCTISIPPASAAASESAPRSDGCVWNIDFENFIDGWAGLLNAGVRQLGDGAVDVPQTEAFILNSSDKAFAGKKCAHIFTKTCGPGAQIGLQRRFNVPVVADEVVEFVYRPTAGEPVDLHDFVLWKAAGTILYANGTASDGTYNLDIQAGGDDARVRNAAAGLKQTEWIRIVMARNNARKTVELWAGPPDAERYIGKYPDANPDRRIGNAWLGNHSPSANNDRGAGYWDDIRVGKRLTADGRLAPGEMMRDVSRELPKIAYPIEVGREKQLFVDNVVIESAKGLKRTLNPLSKHPSNPLLQAEEPWEVKCQYFLPYMTLRESPDKPFRTWYGCYIRDEEGKPKRKLTYVCLAESDDGLHWTRRNVNRYKIDGAAENAAVWEGRAFKTIFDPIDPDPNRRYKGMTRVNGFTPVFSPDGIQWTMQPEGALSQAFDATTFHWNPVENKWIASVKVFCNQKRTRGYAESDDFLHWTDTYPMLACDDKDGPKDQTYSMRIFRYESVFVGLLKIYHLDTDQCDMQLAFSRNAKHWERLDRTVFLTNAKEPGGYDHGNIDEAGDPIPMGDQLWFYYSGRSTLHEEKSAKPDGSLCLGTLRLDGFMSVDAGDEEGTLVTKPLRLTGNSLYVNADAKDGEIRVEIVDSESLEPIEGFAKENCATLNQDSIKLRCFWQKNSAADLPKDKPVRLKFHLRNAKIYAFWTETDS